MALRHNNLRRIGRRSLEELRATIDIARTTSIRGAVVTLLAKVDIQKMNRNGFQEPPAVKRRLLKKHAVMLEYFEKKFFSFTENYDFNRELPESNSELHDRIWLCWWQGLENAPDIVKVCMASVQRNAGDYKVTIITEKNYKDYVRFPEWLEEKYRAGIISRTHYSDLLRFSLLAEYGGVWLDASMYCADACFDDYLSMPIWTIRRPDYLHASIASGNFATYSFASQYEYRWVFATIRDFLLNYWKENNLLIDYLMLDYLIVLAQRKDLRIAELINRIPPNNPDCDELFKVLGDPFDESVWKKLEQDSAVFKLTWKQEFPEKIDGMDTFYSKLKERERINKL